ncbi:hypothetical protein [Thermococcus chitonophagus]|uniref:Uncharacterized protein n=1 Tax=Thermococcus chitonophagus TaxID=54262 RepID=A0A160VQP4_9EURY|nr:hypothetical protein [Thermococcus chitonophagus]CUX77082.1 hypothetical protein CHITON_0303 [Thermococcus chitonophagus]
MQRNIAKVPYSTKGDLSLTKRISTIPETRMEKMSGLTTILLVFI